MRRRCAGQLFECANLCRVPGLPCRKERTPAANCSGSGCSWPDQANKSAREQDLERKVRSIRKNLEACAGCSWNIHVYERCGSAARSEVGVIQTAGTISHREERAPGSRRVRCPETSVGCPREHEPSAENRAEELSSQVRFASARPRE